MLSLINSSHLDQWNMVNTEPDEFCLVSLGHDEHSDELFLLPDKILNMDFAIFREDVASVAPNFAFGSFTPVNSGFDRSTESSIRSLRPVDSTTGCRFARASNGCHTLWLCDGYANKLCSESSFTLLSQSLPVSEMSQATDVSESNSSQNPVETKNNVTPTTFVNNYHLVSSRVDRPSRRVYRQKNRPSTDWISFSSEFNETFEKGYTDYKSISKQREERVRIVREQLEKERQAKLQELKRHAEEAQELRMANEFERRSRLKESKAREAEHRQCVEERRRAILDAEEARKQLILQKTMNRGENSFNEARRRNGSSGNVVYAFGSSTSRLPCTSRFQTSNINGDDVRCKSFSPASAVSMTQSAYDDSSSVRFRNSTGIERSPPPPTWFSKTIQNKRSTSAHNFQSQKGSCFNNALMIPPQRPHWLGLRHLRRRQYSTPSTPSSSVESCLWENPDKQMYFQSRPVTGYVGSVSYHRRSTDLTPSIKSQSLNSSPRSGMTSTTSMTRLDSPAQNRPSHVYPSNNSNSMRCSKSMGNLSPTKLQNRRLRSAIVDHKPISSKVIKPANSSGLIMSTSQVSRSPSVQNVRLRSSVNGRSTTNRYQPRPASIAISGILNQGSSDEKKSNVSSSPRKTPAQVKADSASRKAVKGSNCRQQFAAASSDVNQPLSPPTQSNRNTSQEEALAKIAEKRKELKLLKQQEVELENIKQAEEKSRLEAEAERHRMLELEEAELKGIEARKIEEERLQRTLDVRRKEAESQRLRREAEEKIIQKEAELALRMKHEEEERILRKKRIESIMARTRLANAPAAAVVKTSTVDEHVSMVGENSTHIVLDSNGNYNDLSQRSVTRNVDISLDDSRATLSDSSSMESNGEDKYKHVDLLVVKSKNLESSNVSSFTDFDEILKLDNEKQFYTDDKKSFCQQTPTTSFVAVEESI